MSDERLLTVAEVAEYRQVDEQTLRRWIRAGRRIVHHLGGKASYRIQRSALQAFIEGLPQGTGY